MHIYCNIEYKCILILLLELNKACIVKIAHTPRERGIIVLNQQTEMILDKEIQGEATVSNG